MFKEATEQDEQNEQQGEGVWTQLQEALEGLVDRIGGQEEKPLAEQALEHFERTGDTLDEVQDLLKRSYQESPIQNYVSEHYQKVAENIQAIEEVNKEEWRKTLMMRMSERQLEMSEEITRGVALMVSLMNELREQGGSGEQPETPEAPEAPETEEPTVPNGDVKTGAKDRQGVKRYTDEEVLKFRRAFVRTPNNKRYGAISALHKRFDPHGSYETFHAALMGKSYKHVPLIKDMKA